MNNRIEMFMATLVALLVGFSTYQFGRISTQVDCEQLGKFAVGKNVYECKPIKAAA